MFFFSPLRSRKYFNQMIRARRDSRAQILSLILADSFPPAAYRLKDHSARRILCVSELIRRLVRRREPERKIL
jgi:hypothetical protein